MGYSTDFKGVLEFTKELKAKELAFLNTFLGEDAREHPEWGESITYIDLKLTDDFSGIKWNGAEKTYDMDKAVNLIIRQMKARFPDFGLKGQLVAQGDRAGDHWLLVIGKDGLAHKQEIPVLGQEITCPHCNETFILEKTKS